MRAAGWIFIVTVGIIGFVTAGLFWPSTSSQVAPIAPVIPLPVSIVPTTRPAVPGSTMHLVATTTTSPETTESIPLSDILKYMHHISGQQQPMQVILVGIRSPLFFQITSLMNSHRMEYWWAMVDVPSPNANTIVSRLKVVCPQIPDKIIYPVIVTGDHCTIEHNIQGAAATLGIG